MWRDVYTRARGVCNACISWNHADNCVALQVVGRILRFPLFPDPICSVHDGATFADIPDLPPVDLLALPGSILPISLTARFAKDNLLRASVACPPLLRIGCLQQRQDGSDIIDEIDMLCAVRTLALVQDLTQRHATRHTSTG
jgi:hypothetical protein